MATKKTFADRLRSAITASGLSISELARSAGLTRQGLTLLLSGKRKPAWETVCQLADILNVKIEVFRS